MKAILQLVDEQAVRRFEPGGVVIEQGTTTGRLFFLVEGAVEVVKDEVVVGTCAEAGAVFGELAALLGGCHTATVRAVNPSAFFVVENPRDFLLTHPQVALEACELLARRLDGLNHYLVDVKRQFAEHSNHLGIVDQVLETLMHRQGRRSRPTGRITE